jgi:hypothetical protein
MRKICRRCTSGQPMPLKDLASLMQADYGKLTKVVKDSGMKPQ